MATFWQHKTATPPRMDSLLHCPGETTAAVCGRDLSTLDYCPLATPFLTCLVLGLHCTFTEGRPVTSSNTPSAG